LLASLISESSTVKTSVLIYVVLPETVKSPVILTLPETVPPDELNLVLDDAKAALA